jgi:hypothetical protein
MKARKFEFCVNSLLSLQDEFAGVVTTERDRREVESLRGRMSEAERQVEGLSPEGDASQFERLLSQIFGVEQH